MDFTPRRSRNGATPKGNVHPRGIHPTFRTISSPTGWDTLAINLSPDDLSAGILFPTFTLHHFSWCTDLPTCSFLPPGIDLFSSPFFFFFSTTHPLRNAGFSLCEDTRKVLGGLFEYALRFQCWHTVRRVQRTWNLSYQYINAHTRHFISKGSSGLFSSCCLSRLTVQLAFDTHYSQVASVYIGRVSVLIAQIRALQAIFLGNLMGRKETSHKAA